MKNLVKRYQLPTSGWEYWYMDDWYCFGCDWDDNEDSYENPGPNKYLDNPINILPERQSMNYDEWDTKYRRHYRRNEAYVRATAIIHHSEGLHSSELFRKVKECLKYRRTRESVQELINEYLDKTELEDGVRYFKNRDGSYDNHKYYKQYGGYYIFENERGYIEIHTKGKPKGTPRDWRKHYEMKQWKRRSDKESIKDRQRMAHFYLTMINKPELFKFFDSLKREYDSLNEVERNSKRERPTPKTKNHLGSRWSAYYEMWRWKHDRRAFTLEKRRRRDKIRRDLDDMMRGDFSSYYNSKQYLYSIYKECHHFASP